MSTPAQRALVWSLVAGALAVVLAAELRRRAFEPEVAALTVGSVDGPLFAILGGLILHRRRGHRIGRLYLAIGLLLSLFQLTNGPGAENWPLPLVWFNSWGWVVGPLLVITFGTLLLPDGERPTTRLAVWAWRLSLAAVVSSTVVLPYDMDPMPPPLGRALPELPTAVGEGAFLAWAVVTLAAVLSSPAATVLRYRRATSLERQRLRWIASCTVLAVAVYLAGDVITRLPGFTHEHNFALVVAIPAVGVTVAIVRHRMLDIDRLVARSLSYLLVSVALAAIYLGVVLTATTAVPAAADSDLVIAASTLLAAAAFGPVRRHVQRAVDRRFHRSSYDAERLVATFSARLRDQIDLQTVAAELVATSSASLRPTAISLWTPAPEVSRNDAGTLEAYT